MSEYCVVVADGTKARFFTLEDAEDPAIQSGPTLVEEVDVKNFETGSLGKDAWANTKSGRNASPGGGQAHGYDDHREQHTDEYLRRFAKDIAKQAQTITNQNNSKRLVLVAANRMLGILREVVNGHSCPGVEIFEAPKDLANFNAQDIHNHLGEAGLLPQRKPLSA